MIVLTLVSTEPVRSQEKPEIPKVILAERDCFQHQAPELLAAGNPTEHNPDYQTLPP